MNVLETMSLAVRSLLRSKMRSFLTALGIIIGVGAVIAMVAIGDGARASVQKVFDSMGTHLLIVRSGSTNSGGARGGSGSQPTLTWDDLEALRTQVPSVRAAAPEMRTSTQVFSEDQNWTTSAAAEGRYRAGVGNIIELSDAQLSATNAAVQRVQATYNLATARTQLARALGRQPGPTG